jgi:DNA (cytosine-5)-methyltransferase 1
VEAENQLEGRRSRRVAAIASGETASDRIEGQRSRAFSHAEKEYEEMVSKGQLMAPSKVDRKQRILELVKAKTARLRDDDVPLSNRPARVLDLFSGCGGLFLGFNRAGATSIGGVEIDPLASLSYATNFHKGAPKEEFAAHAAPKDITLDTNSPARVLQGWGFERHGETADIIVGGPPCPAFARVGRAKLREVRDHPEAFRHDPRATLYLPYLQYVEDLAPVALVMENVPDILNFGGHNLAEEICEALDALGYECSYTLLNAANYGVPQMRERFFLMAVHSSLGASPSFPKGTHSVSFPPGYEGSRQVALKHIQALAAGTTVDGQAQSHFLPTPGLIPHPHPHVTAEEALSDLPLVMGHLEGTDKRGARRFTNAVGYRHDGTLNSYAEDMRSWPGFESNGLLMDHVTRCLSDRDYRLFGRMRPGHEYPEAHALAEKLFDAAMNNLGVKAPSKNSAAWQELRKKYVPPYDPGKFPNKWRKMEADQPVRTLMAHLGKDTYSHIHYDSGQARTITVREAARLQSFPDGFAFSGTMNPAFRQIGNSVPPLLSFALAKHLLGVIGSVERETEAPRAAHRRKAG